MQIPMVDLRIQYQQLKTEIDQALAAVLDSTQFILGSEVTAFEQEIAMFLGVRHAVGVASGTDALHLALLAAGVGPGDEVITSPFTFIATAEAIAYVGATPVFVDIDPQTFNIDPVKIAQAITSRTKVVLPVHLFGQPADLLPLQELCKKNGLLLVEDCAQSCGADYAGTMTGAWGDLGCFSFFPSKNLGCFGDGGLVTTNDDKLAEQLRVLRNHGSRERYHHAIIGVNSRLDSLQAAVLRVKLKQLERFNRQRRTNAHRYSQQLAALGIITPFEDGKGTHVYHQYTILVEDRELLQQALTAAGVSSAIYYPIPLHRQEVFADACAGLSLPVTEDVACRCLSLPIYPELNEEQIERVVEVIRKAANGQR
ncbi:MAG: erythromycin biosynthesis sensory transduction protein eryC1 [Desulfuromonas sp.]|nr:MAG: erythromycin biosynthesis sensory transduction protein eryC1 [Desulfuromonas sp.]